MSGGSGQSPDVQMMAEAAGVSPDELKKWQLAHNVQQAFNAIASGFGGGQGGGQAQQSFDPRSKLSEIAKMRQMQLQMQQRQQIEASLPQISQQTGLPIEQIRYLSAAGKLQDVLGQRDVVEDAFKGRRVIDKMTGAPIGPGIPGQSPIAPQWQDGQLMGGFDQAQGRYISPEALGAPAPGPAARPPTEEERKAFGITGPTYFNRAGEPKGIGGGTTVNVDTKGAGAFATKAAEIQANRYGEMARAADDAVPMLSDIDAMGSLMNGMQTGKTAEARLGLAQYAKAWGMDDIANGLTDGKLGEMEAFRALTNKMIPRMRVPGSGTTSDRDAMSFQNSIPQLLNTPDGNRIVMGTFRSMYDYQMQAGDIAKRALRGEITQEQADGALRQMPSPFQLFNEYQKVASPGAGGPVRVQTPEEARRLPKGTPIILPDGRTATVP